MARAVFTPPSNRTDQERMVRAHAAAGRQLKVDATGPSVWGWQGRTLGRRAGQWWLRLLCTPLDKRGGHLWEGTTSAEAALPSSTPRPRLHDLLDWTTSGHAYRAELTEYAPTPHCNPKARS